MTEIFQLKIVKTMIFHHHTPTLPWHTTVVDSPTLSWHVTVGESPTLTWDMTHIDPPTLL